MVLRRVWLVRVLCAVAAGWLAATLLLQLYTNSVNSGQSTKPTFDPQPVHNHRLCLIVPFRDRFEELQSFVPYMHAFLSAQKLQFDILIINQVDELRFNRASLINVGFIESQNKSLPCDYMCMHDVDLLPQNPDISYAYPKHSPYHIASPEYHPRYNYTKFIGGILMLTADHFRLIDGMSNQYWGWGLEDDELFLRFRDANLTIDRPTNLSTDRSNTFAHLHNARLRRRDAVKLPKQREMTRRRDRVSGVSTVQYDMLSRVPMLIGSAPFTVCNVRLHCDRDWTPYCELPSPAAAATGQSMA